MKNKVINFCVAMTFMAVAFLVLASFNFLESLIK